MSAVRLLVVATVGSALGACAGSEEAAVPEGSDGWFTDVTGVWDLDFEHDAGTSAEKLLPETMGGGGALLDADADGDLDLYLVQSGPVPTAAVRAQGTRRPVNRLYANAGDGRLTDATDRSGDAAHNGCGMGVAAGDATGDGLTDLYVTNFGPDVLLVNRGELRFDDATARSGIEDSRWTAGATFFDADADGDLDLYVTGYLDVDAENPTWCGRREPGWRSYCHPDHYDGLSDRFWRNAGDGSFENATLTAGFADSDGKGLGVVAADLDLDGDLDLYVANDSVENRLWTNSGDGTFVDDTLLSGTGVNGRGATEAGMGLACADVDDDLDLDLVVTNLDHESNTLYRNEGGGLFRDATVASGLEAASRMPVGFGCVFEDFDQDGRLDLAVANGHIIDNIALYDDAQTHRQAAQVFAGEGGGHLRALGAQAGELASEPFVGRALLAGDLDGDLDLDLVLVQCGGPAHVFRNDAAAGPALELRGLAPGTRVVVELDDGRRCLRTAGPAPSYFGASHPHVHVGLGDARAVRLEIRAPGSEPREVVFDEPLAGGVWRAEGDG